MVFVIILTTKRPREAIVWERPIIVPRNSLKDTFETITMQILPVKKEKEASKNGEYQNQSNIIYIAIKRDV